VPARASLSFGYLSCCSTGSIQNGILERGVDVVRQLEVGGGLPDAGCRDLGVVMGCFVGIRCWRLEIGRDAILRFHLLRYISSRIKAMVDLFTISCTFGWKREVLEQSVSPWHMYVATNMRDDLTSPLYNRLILDIPLKVLIHYLLIHVCRKRDARGFQLGNIHLDIDASFRHNLD
jgi:hypothetical protein